MTFTFWQKRGLVTTQRTLWVIKIISKKVLKPLALLQGDPQGVFLSTLRKVSTKL